MTDEEKQKYFDEMLLTLKAILADCQDVKTDSCLSMEVGKRLCAVIKKAEGQTK